MSMERVSRNNPCIFCNSTDAYDIRMHYLTSDGEDIVHYCHKTNAEKGDIVYIGTKQYICIAASKDIPVVGKFDLWKEYVSKEEWIAKKKQMNPTWVTNYNPKTKDLLEGEVKTRCAKEQHEFNTFLASLLVLEKKHENALRSEWQCAAYPDIADRILKKYEIRSFPPPDKARFQNGEQFTNSSRKQLVDKLIKHFGDLRGYPIMYQRTGTYWESRPEEERWTFCCQEGILFPCYDKNGYLYRFRIKKDYPDMVLKENIHTSFNGMYGVFHHYYDNNGKRCYSFTPKNSTESISVYGPGSNHSLTLNEKNLPFMGGKPNGKYTNISSVYAKRLPDGREVNCFKNGCRSGSPYSLYYKEENDFRIVIGTEGEKKSIITNEIKGVPVVCIPGVTTFSTLFEKDEQGQSVIDYLKRKGMKYFVVAYDADKEENEKVLAAEKDLITELKKHDVLTLIGDWKGKFNKGIDDILLMGLDIVLKRA